MNFSPTTPSLLSVRKIIQKNCLRATNHILNAPPGTENYIKIPSAYRVMQTSRSKSGGTNKQENVNVLEGQQCPFCKNKTLSLMESEREVPYFGRLLLFSMTCESCKYHKADVESAETHEPAKYEMEISSEEDMKVRIVRSSTATIKIPRITTITPGPSSNGYITNIEGILNRVLYQLKGIVENEEDKSTRKKSKNMIKKLQKVMWGQEKLKITVEDKSGNSAIISEKAKRTKM